MENRIGIVKGYCISHTVTDKLFQTFYRPYPKEGNVFSLSTLGGGGGGQVQPAGGRVSSVSRWGGVRSSRWGGGGQVQPAGGGRVNSVSRWGGGGGSGPAGRGGQVSQPRGGSGPADGEGVRSVSRWGGQVQPTGGGSGQLANGGGQVSQLMGGGQVQPGRGSASYALLRAVCLLRSRRRTVLLIFYTHFFIFID